MLWVKTFFGILFQTALLGIFLYLPALTLNWAEALLFLSIHFTDQINLTFIYDFDYNYVYNYS